MAKTRIPIGAQRAIEALTTEAGVLGDLRHPLGAGNVAERSRDTSGIVRRVFEPGVLDRQPSLRRVRRCCATSYGVVLVLVAFFVAVLAIARYS